MPDEPIIDALNPFPDREGESDRDAQIRKRAYELWELAGRPEGRARDHWLAAEREISSAPPTATPILPGEDIPTMRSPRGAGVPGSQPGDLGMKKFEASDAPKTAGAPKPAPDTSKSGVANRNPAGPRKAGASPRPTGKPPV